MQAVYQSLDKMVRQLIIENATTIDPNISPQTRLAQGSLALGPSVDSKNITVAFDSLLGDIRDMVKPRVDVGLDVLATNPASNIVTVTSGSGFAQLRRQTLNATTTVTVPFENNISVYYVNLWQNKIDVEGTVPGNKLNVAKIVVPAPGLTTKIIDDKVVGGIDAYIVSAKDVFFDADQVFDDDSKEVLRQVMENIPFSKITGDLILTENIKVKNISNSLEIDSNSVKIFYPSGERAAEFNSNGTYYYSEQGFEFAKYTKDRATVGNIVIEQNRLRSHNYIKNTSGFVINDNGDVEFNGLVIRGTIFATAGEIGGWTIAANKIYSTTTGSGIIEGGTYRTSANAGMGANSVILDMAGLRGYNSILGEVFNLPTDGSAPTFSSGIINSTIFEINTNAVLRTSETVGDGTVNSRGILINNTGLYGIGRFQDPAGANLKALADGSIFLSGTIVSSGGNIGGFTIFNNSLSGGTIIGATIIAPTITTSLTNPRVRMDSQGIYYQVATTVGKYGSFKYGVNKKYGVGILAAFANPIYPPFSVLAEQPHLADMRLFNRTMNMHTGSGMVGDLVAVNARPMFCTNSGTPGNFQNVVISSGTGAGTGSGGVGNQYIELQVGANRYKVLHDGIL